MTNSFISITKGKQTWEKGGKVKQTIVSPDEAAGLKTGYRQEISF